MIPAKKILILSSTGMLGWAVGKYFLEKYGEDNIILTYRDQDLAYGRNRIYFDLFFNSNGWVDICTSFRPNVVINCIGIIKTHAEKDVAKTILVNSLFPRQLADYCKCYSIKLIHITTDCVFSGKDGNYDETSPHDPLDIYGKSKSLGEPTNAMTIRTSIIGGGFGHNNTNLVEWAKSKKNSGIQGYTNHIWQGITTRCYAEICERIINGGLYQEGVFHVFSPKHISKCELLRLISKKFNLNLNVEPIEANPPIDRSLSTINDLNNKLNILPIEDQIEDMW